MKAFGIIAVIEAVLLTIAVAFFLHSERRTSFPASVQAPALSLPDTRITPVPVNFDIAPAAGVTATASLTRGGAAASIVVTTDSGQFGFASRPPVQRKHLVGARRP